MFEENSIIGKNPDELPPKGKLRWNCRRGMKELEVLLVPFIEHCYDGFDSGQKRQFVRLLGFDDASLYAWFMGYETPEDEQLALCVKEVQCAVASLPHGLPSI